MKSFTWLFPAFFFERVLECYIIILWKSPKKRNVAFSWNIYYLEVCDEGMCVCVKDSVIAVFGSWSFCLRCMLIFPFFGGLSDVCKPYFSLVFSSCLVLYYVRVWNRFHRYRLHNHLLDECFFLSAADQET